MIFHLIFDYFTNFSYLVKLRIFLFRTGFQFGITNEINEIRIIFYRRVLIMKNGIFLFRAGSNNEKSDFFL